MSLILRPFRHSFPYLTSPAGCQSVFFPIFYSELTTRPVFVRFIRHSVPVFTLSLFFLFVPANFVSLSRHWSLGRGKDRFIFYYSSCLSDMFRVILRLCSSLRPAMGAPWNLFREFDILDIATSVKEKRCIHERSYKMSHLNEEEI